MFTGIVQGRAVVAAMDRKTDFMHLTLKFPVAACQQLKAGASIAINGTCLTVTAFSHDEISFDLVESTLNTTNLQNLKIGDEVNFERSARMGDEIGGHIMSGHVYQTLELLARDQSDNNCILWLERPSEVARYLLPKGFVGLNGCSLTIAEVQEDRFSVYLIPETLALTTFGTLPVGSRINLELDSSTQAIVDTVESYLQAREQL